MKETRQGRRVRLADRAALMPYGIWAALFVIVPLIFVAYYAFTDNGFGFTTENITRFFTAVSTVTGEDGAERGGPDLSPDLLALPQAGAHLHGALPAAGLPHRLHHRPGLAPGTETMMTLLMVPMWMNFLIRTYAWMTILQDTGLLNGLLKALHLGTVQIIGTEGAVVVGMVYDYLPFMIMPIYSIMAKMDGKLLEAARDLGCNNLGVLRRVIWPLSLPGVISGITMVLVPSISTFYISQKLGNGRIYLIGDAIEGQYVAGNLHFAAAIAFILMVILLASMALANAWTRRHVYGGA